MPTARLHKKNAERMNKVIRQGNGVVSSTYKRRFRWGGMLVMSDFGGYRL